MITQQFQEAIYINFVHKKNENSSLPFALKNVNFPEQCPFIHAQFREQLEK